MFNKIPKPVKDLAAQFKPRDLASGLRPKNLIPSLANPVTKEARGVKERLSGLFSRFGNFAQNRTDESIPEAFEQDFGFVLYAWGIEEDEISKAIRNLQIRIMLMLLPGILAIYLLWANGFAFIQCLLLACTIIGVSTDAWRIEVLESRQYKRFALYSLCKLVFEKTCPRRFRTKQEQPAEPDEPDGTDEPADDIEADETATADETDETDGTGDQPNS